MTELTGGLMSINQRCCISTRTTVGPEGSAPYLCVDMEGPPHHHTRIWSGGCISQGITAHRIGKILIEVSHSLPQPSSLSLALPPSASLSVSRSPPLPLCLSLSIPHAILSFLARSFLLSFFAVSDVWPWGRFLCAERHVCLLQYLRMGKGRRGDREAGGQH